MKLALVFASLLAAAPAAAELRVAVVHPEAYLPSEARAFADVEKRLVKAKLGPVKLVDAVPAEAAFAATPGDKLPDEWAGADTVVVLTLNAPTGPAKKRRSAGLAGIAVFRPPLVEPVYVERVDGEIETPVYAPDVGKWIAGAVTLAARAK